MQLTSPAFEQNSPIPPRYTCDGDNVSPPFTIRDVPSETVSLVLIVDDPDAPAGTWTHWTLWNISPSARDIAEAQVPSGANQGITSFGTVGYGGPCPPNGVHRYFFKLYALGTTLNLAKDANVEQLTKAIKLHVIAEAHLIGTYERAA